MNTKKELAIVFGVTSNLTFALANVILGLKKHSPDLASEIIVFHDEISKKDQDLLKKILPCRFIKYEFPIKNTSAFKDSFFKQFSNMAYSRFECFNLLSEFKKVLWLDVDILIQNDISGLLDYTKTGLGILPGGLMKDNFLDTVEEYELNRAGYWTGTIIFTDAISNFEKLTAWSYEKLIEYAPKLYLPDQAIINILIQHFNIKPMEIDKDLYCAHPAYSNHKKAIIVHAYRPKKFWDCWIVKEWQENNNVWIQLGGTPYKGKRCSTLIRLIEKWRPGSPHPLRKPKDFVKFIWITTFSDPYIKQSKEAEKVKEKAFITDGNNY